MPPPPLDLRWLPLLDTRRTALEKLPPECTALIAEAPAGVNASMLAKFETLLELHGLHAGGLMPALSTPASVAATGLRTRLKNSSSRFCRFTLPLPWFTPLAKRCGTAGLLVGDVG